MPLDTGITSIGQIAIAVSDIKRSVEFYRDKLGLKLLFEVPPNLAFFEASQNTRKSAQ
jgi:catechol 2,3-dioxygenase-like lactoylglutathione lyase family enzyme